MDASAIAERNTDHSVAATSPQKATSLVAVPPDLRSLRRHLRLDLSQMLRDKELNLVEIAKRVQAQVEEDATKVAHQQRPACADYKRPSVR
jgi:hypothetical protein